MRQLVDKHWHTNRAVVSDENNALVRDVAAELGTEPLSVPCRSECLTWVIPDKWTVRQAWLEAPNGDRIADFAGNPLNVKAYSMPFTGKVSRDELARHVFSDPTRPDWVVWDYRNQYDYSATKDWGFSLPHSVATSLPEGEYTVNIDAELSEGVMDILDYSLPGDHPETFYFAAHTCHPYQVNDGIACVAILVELFKWMREKQRKYTYRVILGSEYYAGAATLHRGENIDKLKGGFYLDMLGNGMKLGYSTPYAANSYVERAFIHALREQGCEFFVRPYRKLWGNDEMFLDGPDFNIPTVCLGRDYWPFYHTDRDIPQNASFGQLSESLELMKKFVQVIEDDRILHRKYKGPLYLSRYGLVYDAQKNRDAYDHVQFCQMMMDGRNSCLDVADAAGCSYGFVDDFAKRVEGLGLMETTPFVVA